MPTLFLKNYNRPNLSFATRLAQTIRNHFFEAKACIRRDVIKKEIASDCARSIGKQKWKCCGDWSIDINWIQLIHIGPVHSNCRWSSSTLANCQQLGRGWRVTSRATSNHRPRLPLRPLCAGGTPLRARTVAPPRHVWRLKKFEESPSKCLKTASKCINCNAVTASNIKPIQATEPPSAQLCDARLFLQSSWTNWYARYYYNEDTGETSICLKTYSSYQMFLTDAFSCTFALLLASCLVWLVLRFFIWYVLLRTASKPFKQEHVQRVGCHVFTVVHNSLFMARSYPLSNFSFLRRTEDRAWEIYCTLSIFVNSCHSSTL